MFELFDQNRHVRKTMGATLPHWYQQGATYFVTFRTDDSIPKEVSERWHTKRLDWLATHNVDPEAPEFPKKFSELSAHHRAEYHEQFSKAFLENLDKGLGACPFKNPQIAQIVEDTLLHFDEDRYEMGDFVVMPNHVHLIVGLKGETEIEKQCYSWKKFSAGKINKALNKKGRFWKEESFDHLIRSSKQLDAIAKYIRDNPKHLNAGEYLYYTKDHARE